MAQHLCILLDRYHPHDIILLGDVKHNIPSSTHQERTDVQRFIATLSSYGTLHIVPGNHDGNIKHLVPSDVLVHSSDGFIVDNIGFIHGHRWPTESVMDADYVIFGHIHPTIMLTDRLGYKTYEPCWLRGRCNRQTIQKRYPTVQNPHLIMLPAFNSICGGIAVNKEPLIGPFAQILDHDHAEVYLLDGSLLGKLKDLR